MKLVIYYLFYMINKDILIIGAGPVGIFTGFQCGFNKLTFATIESSEILGGQCAHLYADKPIYDIPAYKSLTGKELIEQLLEQASIFDPEYYINDHIQSIEMQDKDHIIVTTVQNTFSVKAIIIAAGMGIFTPVKPNIEYDEINTYFSIKDKNIFKDLDISIFGGGDSAIDWAIELSNIAKKVYLIHRRNKFRAIESKIEKLSQVEIILNEQIQSFKNNIVTLQNKSFYSDKIIFCFGMNPNLSNLIQLGININHGKINVSNDYMTNISNIYAIGDIAEYEYKVPYISVGFAEAAILCKILRKRLYNNDKFEHSTTMFNKL